MSECLNFNYLSIRRHMRKVKGSEKIQTAPQVCVCVYIINWRLHYGGYNDIFTMCLIKRGPKSNFGQS